METICTFLRTLRAVLAQYREGASFEACDTTAHGDCDFARRMNHISDSCKALLLASPGR